MKFLKSYEDLYKLYEMESPDIPVDLTQMFKKSPERIEQDYEKMLGRKGELSTYLREKGKEFTFGILKAVFKDAIQYKKRREIVKGSYKMLHRAVPITLAFFFFPIWLIGNIFGASRALNKVIMPLLKDPETNYGKFLEKFITGLIAVTEGEIKYIMEDDWFYSICYGRQSY